jgi:iron complex transport system substrate-binding protein
VKINLIIFLLIFVSCAEQGQKNGARIVSLSPAMTEVIFALGAQDALVGVTTYCDYPQAACDIYKVGDFSNPSIERIVGLQPTLIILNLPEQARIERELRKLKKNIFVSSPRKLEDIYAEITALGEIIGRNKEADSLVSCMRSSLKSGGKGKKPVYIEISPRPLVTVGSASFLNELVELAGGMNIFADIDKDYPVVTQEEVIRRDPQVIIVLHPDDIMTRLGWSRVSALKNKKVFRDLNPDLLMRPGPRLVQGFRELEAVFEQHD